MDLLLNKKNKFIYLILIISFILLLFFGIPSFAKYKNNISTTYEVWSGEVALDFGGGDGSSNNPYIISNGEELAYLATQLIDNDYEGYYFEITDDIVINDGIFIYDDVVKYSYNNQIYYVYEDKYYSDSLYTDFVGSFNMFPSLDGFKGVINGNYNTIYGLYINSLNASLFTDLKGSVSNLYVDNSLMVGSNISSILASNASESNISNVLVDGIVINNNINNVNKEIDVVIPTRSFVGSDSISLDVPDYSYLGNITNIRLSGEYTGDVVVSINDNEFSDGIFEVDVNDQVVINLQSELDTSVDVSFSSVKFIVTYDYSIASGLVGESNNTIITNCINKADVYGSVISSGIVGVGESTIKNTYNNGNIKSNYISSGIVGFSDSVSVSLDHVYNTGLLDGTVSGLVGLVYKSNLSITNSFIVSDNYLVDSIYDSTINSKTNYHIYKGINGLDESILVSEEDLKSSEFLTNYLLYSSDLDVMGDNVWIFDNNYPILYFDDIVSSSAELYVNSSIFDSYRTSLNINKINGNITFMISDVDLLNVTTKYYYISDSLDNISRSDLDSLDWLEYSDLISISDEGIYTIYVKLVDDNGYVSYINSDTYILDNTPALVDINLNDNHYNKISDGEIYLDGLGTISVSASDNLSGVSNIQYYLSNEVILEESFDDLEWLDYSSDIIINEVGEFVLYVKVIDNCGFITYASTPLIVNDGYVVTINPLGLEMLSDFEVTSSSSVVYNIKYNNNKSINIDNHNIVTNVSLPISTRMTLIDNINHKYYYYVVDYNCSDSCVYSFDLFKEIGRSSDKYYIDSSVINEDYTLVLDFSDSTINESINNINININATLDDVVVRPTLINSNKFSVNSLEKSNHVFTTTFDGEIVYNSDSLTEIMIDNLLSSDIYDTSYYDKNLGITIEFVDSSYNLVNNKYLKNFVFRVNDKVYSPGNDGVIRANLGTDVLSQVNLSIITYQGDFDLEEGTYYLRIGGFTSLDGLFTDSYIGDYILVPVIVEPVVNIRTDYTFNVDIISPIVDFSKSNIVDFNILYDNIENPNIKVSLYKKDKLTAYNQDYSLVDLQEYSLDNLNKYIDSFYDIDVLDTGVYSINLDSSKFDKTGYRFDFDLYDGNNKIGSISKYVIVR